MASSEEVLDDLLAHVNGWPVSPVTARVDGCQHCQKAGMVTKTKTSSIGLAILMVFTTEATQQYRQLAMLRVAHLVPVGAGFSELRIIDTPANREAMQIAYDLVNAGVATGTEVDGATRELLQKDHTYVESMIASGHLSKHEKVELSAEQTKQLELLLLR